MYYAKRTEQGDICLTPGELIGKPGTSGLPITLVTLSRMGCTFLWFTRFLEGQEGTPDTHEIDGKKYQAFRASDAVFLKEVRGGRIASTVGFSLREIPVVLEEIRQIMTEEFVMGE
ncbi:MAG: hypothetical protein LBD47_01700 [Treponema sp.]|jgi:hypothetical protein|nr:hypothetical protein [Treponema sp.]